MRTEARTRALVVDDHPTNRLMLQIYLEDAMGADVVEAADGASAVELYRAGGFDLVFMDIEMPVMDGLAATAAIRAFEQQAALPPAPIIVVSAFCQSEDHARSRQAGASAHVAKPLVFSALRDLIEDLTSRLAPGRQATEGLRRTG